MLRERVGDTRFRKADRLEFRELTSKATSARSVAAPARPDGRKTSTVRAIGSRLRKSPVKVTPAKNRSCRSEAVCDLNFRRLVFVISYASSILFMNNWDTRR
ncbi:unnamed protein product, partial [Iphiclides podalirius]